MNIQLIVGKCSKAYSSKAELGENPKLVKIQLVYYLFINFLFFADLFRKPLLGTVITAGVDCLSKCLFIVNIYSQQGFTNNSLLCKSSLQWGKRVGNIAKLSVNTHAFLLASTSNYGLSPVLKL